MRRIEVSAKTVAEAKQVALEQLGVEDDSDVQFEVVEESGRGLFGIKSGPVRLRATLGGDDTTETSMVADTGQSTEDVGDEPDTDTTERVLALLREIVKIGEFEVEVLHRGNHGRYVQAEFIGRDAAYFTARQAELLDGLQYLANVLVGKKLDHHTRVILDAQNYRKRRAESLRNLAVSLSYEVKSRQEEAQLDPLPAHERRIIHQTLLTDDDVDTYSEGEEPHRYVVISPKRKG